MVEIINVGIGQEADIVRTPAAALSTDAHDEQREREVLLARINNEISQLQMGPQSDEVRELIAQLQGLSTQISNGTASVGSARMMLKTLEIKADREAIVAAIEEGASILQVLSLEEDVQYAYSRLSHACRQSINTLKTLLDKPVLSHDEKVQMFEHLSVMDEFHGTPAGRKIAEKALNTPEGKEAIEGIRKCSTKSVITAKIQIENVQRLSREFLETVKEPEIKKHLFHASVLGAMTETDFREMKKASKSEAAAHAWEEKRVNAFLKQNASRYQSMLAQFDEEDRALIEKAGGISHQTIERIFAIEESPERKEAALLIIQGKSTNVTEEARTDAALLEAVSVVKKIGSVEMLHQMARDYDALGQDKSKFELVAPEISRDRRIELLAQKMQENDPNLKAEHAKKAASTLIDEVMKTYPNVLDIRQAGEQEMFRITHSASRSAMGYTATQMATHFLTTDKKVQNAVALQAGEALKQEMLAEGATKEEAEKAGKDRASWVRFGGDAKDVVLSAVKGDFSGVEKNATLLAEKTGRAVESGWDKTLGAVGISTMSNQLREQMDAFNKKELGWTKITDGNGRRIFDADMSGKISLDEMKATLAKHGYKDLDSLDKNSDGDLSQKELAAALDKIMAKERKEGIAKFEQSLEKLAEKGWDNVKDKKTGKLLFDKDGDGKMEYGEVMKALNDAKINLAKYDVGHDGLSVAELSQALKDAERVNSGLPKKGPSAGKGQSH